jgi:hypothetical protein
MALTQRERLAAIARANDPLVFPGLSRITRLDGTVGNVPLTQHQRIMLAHMKQYPWTYVCKSRQAMSSVVHILDLLRHVMYSPGQMGMIIGDKEDTYKELIRRMGVAYAGYPEAIRTELARPVSSESIAFGEPHNGIIQGLTGGGENPAIGFSPDYAVISEYGLFQHYEQFDKAFWPAINRRPNAKCRIETTPGRYQTSAHLKWVSALSGDSAFRALFLEWWRDATYVQHQKPFPRDFQRTSEEEKYAERINTFQAQVLTKNEYWYPYIDPFPIRDEQLWFRRVELNTNKTLAGDARLFDSQYPPTPYDGWLINQSPTIPPEPVEKMLLTAHRSPEGCETFYHPDGTVCASLEELVAAHPNMPFLICGDGKGYGKRGDGDPAAITLFNMWDWSEAGTWSGDEDPGELTPRILRWQKLTNAHVVVETNKDGLAAALQQANCPNLWWDGDQPGWFSSGTSKPAALVALVNMLRRGEITLFTWETLQQGLTWDGKTRGEVSSRRAHHWDRWITILIFAYAAPLLGLPRRPKPAPPKSSVLTAETFLAEWDRLDRQRAARWDDDRY